MASIFRSMFSARWWQVTTYLCGVALFSISFLVFLNSSVSFVITDLIGQKDKVGNAVGSLGFADELVALVACPFWGLVSDRLGVRIVCVLGYCIVGLSLFAFVQARNVYPQLLLARLFFSIGGAATSTMVTAILPTMTSSRDVNGGTENGETGRVRTYNSESVSSTPTSAPQSPPPEEEQSSRTVSESRPNPSRVAGLVGMFTGIGALVALALFLPLPARLQRAGSSPADAISHSFYIVGAIALLVSIICALGLRNLASEQHKGWTLLFGRRKVSDDDQTVFSSREKTFSYVQLLGASIGLGFKDMQIGLGYLGGFVARASSVGVSLFISLYVNHYFISLGLCDGDPSVPPSEVKDQCRRAYTLAAELSGVSQLIALICAPAFGYLDGRYRRFNAPLLLAALAGVIGYIAFAQIPSPDPKAEGGGPAIFAVMALLGISQIGAIVCSLSLLGRGIEAPFDHSHLADSGLRNDPAVSSSTAEPGYRDTAEESSALIPSHLRLQSGPPSSRAHLKGSIAGIYSLAGGAGILLLTKLGGHLFDTLSPGAPFYMLAIFNGILLLVGLTCVVFGEVRMVRSKIRI